MRLRLSPARTMRIAQKLYEGVDIGEGEPTGLITYMRTDSTRVSGGAVKSARKVISGEFGSDYLPAKPPVYKQKKKPVQGAHEAIRPSNPSLLPQTLKDTLDRSEFNLYRLIWQRFTASQMAPTVLDQTTIQVKGGPDFLFRSTGSVVAFDGFRKVYPSKEKSEESSMPRKISEGEEVDKLAVNPEQHFTKPPPYFSDSTLIKELDKRGIGRPSTFAETVSRLHKREYVKKERGNSFPPKPG